MKRTKLESFIEEMVVIIVGIGVVWFAAMIFNPALTSGTVWFVGFLYGNLSMFAYRIYTEIRSKP